MNSTEWSASNDPEPMLSSVLPAASDRKRRLFAVACCRRVEDWLVAGDIVLDARKSDYRKAVDTAERFDDGRATDEELSAAFWGADDSAFCNQDLTDVSPCELRKASLGDDAGWPVRLQSEMSDEDWEEMEAHPDPSAWLESEDHADDYLSNSVDPFRGVAKWDAAEVGETIGRQVLLLVRHFGGREREAQERDAQAALIRDIFGNPFRPVAFDPRWRTDTAVAIATRIYESLDFGAMPILADALQDAGCDSADVLDHCRGARPLGLAEPGERAEGGPHVRGCWVVDLVLGKG